MKRTLATVLMGAAASACAQPESSSSTTEAVKAPVEIQFLTISDWHAQLDPSSGIGGAAVLSTYFQADRAASPNTLTLTAGDAFGASPILSGFFDETPAIRALKMMGVEVDTFGNHNFDRGTAFLQTKIDEAGAATADGAPLHYVDADLDNIHTNLKHVAPYEMFKLGGIRVAVIGATNPDVLELVKPGSLGTMTVSDPAAALNAARVQAVEDGAQVTVAIVHMGVTNFQNGQATGPLIDLANNLTGFDFVFGDHTDMAYQGMHNGALVVENRSKGRTYARVRASIDPVSGEVLSRSSQLVTPLVSGVTPDPRIVNMLAPYRAQLAPAMSQVIGTSSAALPRADSCGNALGRTCESLIGDVITDAMRFESEADFAITNSGGIRADMTCPTTDLGSDFCPPFVAPPYPITTGQVLSVLPFGNVVVRVRVDGAELKAMLENGVSTMPAVGGRFPQVSGLCFTYDISVAAGSRVLGAVRQAADGSCTGAPVDLTAAASYLVLQNDFTVVGGDGYPNLTGRFDTLDPMDAVVTHYLTHEQSISPTLQGRVQCTSSGATLCPVTLP